MQFPSPCSEIALAMLATQNLNIVEKFQLAALCQSGKRKKPATAAEEKLFLRPEREEQPGRQPAVLLKLAQEIHQFFGRNLPDHLSRFHVVDLDDFHSGFPVGGKFQAETETVDHRL